MYHIFNKSPRGLNAHLNLRKLPMVQLGVCHQLKKLWRPPPPNLWTAMNNFNSPHKKVFEYYLRCYFEFAWFKVLALGGPPPGPPSGPHVPYMKNFEPLAPKDDSWQVWLKSKHAFLQEVDENNYSLHRAPSPTCYPPWGPIGATLGTVINNLYSSPKKVSTLHNLTVKFWIWRRSLKFAWFWPLGALPLAPHEGHMWIPDP